LYGTGKAEGDGYTVQYLCAAIRSRVVFMIDTVRLCIAMLGFSQKEKFILLKAEFCYDLYYFSKRKLCGLAHLQKEFI
jgi:hypothetical protein